MAGLLLPVVAAAQFSASASVESDYRFRGVSLSASRPSLRLSGNFDSPSGAYAGVSVTQAEVSQGDRYAQWLGYAGYSMPASAGKTVELGATYSHFAGSGRYDFAEAYAGLLSAHWSLRLNFSPDYFGRHVQTAYAEANGQVQLSDAVRLFGHVGLLAPLAGGDPAVPDANRPRADLRVGAGWAMRDIDVQLAWTTASRGGPFPAGYGQRRSAWTIGATYSF
jgi:uncharacterized protein (TIGR02001 family)